MQGRRNVSQLAESFANGGDVAVQSPGGPNGAAARDLSAVYTPQQDIVGWPGNHPVRPVANGLPCCPARLASQAAQRHALTASSRDLDLMSVGKENPDLN